MIATIISVLFVYVPNLITRSISVIYIYIFTYLHHEYYLEFIFFMITIFLGDQNKIYQSVSLSLLIKTFIVQISIILILRTYWNHKKYKF